MTKRKFLQNIYRCVQICVIKPEIKSKRTHKVGEGKETTSTPGACNINKYRSDVCIDTLYTDAVVRVYNNRLAPHASSWQTTTGERNPLPWACT